ncbi:MAG: DNA recombination protein RmuC [Gemmatimonadales bacterium]
MRTAAAQASQAHAEEDASLRAQLDAVRERLRIADGDRERLTAVLEGERRSADERLAAFAKAEALFRETFTALSAQALQANSATFLELAKVSMGEFQQAAKSDLEARQQSIDQLVKPMQEGLVRVDEKLQAFDKERAASAASLQEHLRSMAEAQQQLTGETQQLVRALRTPHVRGQWGELQLKRVVELAGMQEHCDFVEQESVRTDEGRLRPDLIVHLPGKKVVVVDSKAPLSAYLDAVEAADDETRGLLLDQHVKQVRDHVSALASKDYASQFAEAPDFVVMFLPGEAFFSAACQRDPNLIEFAITSRVIPASPTTLVTVLKAVYYGWQQERIAKNSEEIRDEAMELYARMRVVGEHLLKIKKGLEGAVNAYNSAVGSLESRVLPTARRLRALGAGSGTEIEVLEPVDSVPRLAAAAELVIEDTTSTQVVEVSPADTGEIDRV